PPRPGPISTTVSAPVSSRASTIRWRMRLSLRKCWPRLFRIGGVRRGRSASFGGMGARSAAQQNDRQIVPPRRALGVGVENLHNALENGLRIRLSMLADRLENSFLTEP